MFKKSQLHEHQVTLLCSNANSLNLFNMRSTSHQKKTHVSRDLPICLQASEIPHRPSDPNGSSPCICYYAFPDSLCLGHVIACCLWRAPASPEQQRSILQPRGHGGRLHLSHGLPADTQGHQLNTSCGKSSVCVCDMSRIFLRDMHLCLQTQQC